MDRIADALLAIAGLTLIVLHYAGVVPLPDPVLSLGSGLVGVALPAVREQRRALHDRRERRERETRRKLRQQSVTVSPSEGLH